MEKSEFQQLIFQHIKNLIPANFSLATEVAGILDIGEDGAYRRIRGEKGISLEEAKVLALHFKFSLDQFLGASGNMFLFDGNLTDDSKKNLTTWLEDILGLLKKIGSSPDSFLYYTGRDAPFCSFFQVPELAAFKFFFWRRSILFDEQQKKEKFSLLNEQDFAKLGKEIISIYNKIPGVEAWTLDSITTTLSQIEFYRESEVFESQETAEIIYDKLEDLVLHWEKQAELGSKFNFGDVPNPGKVPLQVYINESNLWNNCWLAEFNKTRMAIVNHSILNAMQTTDRRFTEHVHNSIHTLIKRSTLISDVGEKQRIRFFYRMREKIKASRRVI